MLGTSKALWQNFKDRLAEVLKGCNNALLVLSTPARSASSDTAGGTDAGQPGAASAMQQAHEEACRVYPEVHSDPVHPVKRLLHATAGPLLCLLLNAAGVKGPQSLMPDSST